LKIKNKLKTTYLRPDSKGRVIFRRKKKIYIGPTIDGVTMMLVEITSGPVRDKKPEFIL
jgi:hypothetical protein